jgi:hypothetical protein
MSDTKISNETLLSGLTGNEKVPASQPVGSPVVWLPGGLTIAQIAQHAFDACPDMLRGFIEAVANKTYSIVLKATHGGTISETVTKSVSGTCTATFKINTTALGGSDNSVSSGEQTQAHSTANVFAAGDDIVVTISANAACVDMAFTVKYTRQVA